MKSTSGRKRSRRAVEDLVRYNERAIRGYLAVLDCPEHLLDDIVQDTFLAVLGSRFEHRRPESTRAFLRKAARHLLLKALQRERREVRLEDLDGAERAWDEFDDDEDGEDYLDALKACLRRLKERVRKVLVLRYRERLTRKDIAARLDLSASAVNAILVRSRRKLRECVERSLDS